jgi:hypothetical protein
MTFIPRFCTRIIGTTWGFRWQCRLQRWRRACRYATDTLSADDAGWIRHRCQAYRKAHPFDWGLSDIFKDETAAEGKK